MSSYSTARQERVPSPSPLPQAFVALAGGMALFVILLFAVVIGFDRAYAGQIYPGVSMGGVDLSGLEPQQAAALISERMSFPETGKIIFQYGDKYWIAKPAEVGLFLDAETSAQAAYNLGRQGGPVARLFLQFQAWYTGTDLPPLLIFDERVAQAYLGRIAAEINLPTIEASLSVNGDQVTVSAGQVGRTVDVQETLAPLEGQLRTLADGILPVVVQESPPVILDASQQAQIARQILSTPLTLKLADAKEGDPGPWTIEPKQLARMLVIERVEGEDGARYQVDLNKQALRTYLEALGPKLNRTPDNARFIFNDDTRQLDLIQPATIGQALDVDASIQAINDKIAKGEHTVDLVMVYTQPEVADNATAEQLGIRELVSSQTTYFYGSSSERIHNIETAAARFHGVLVPPGAVFSMAQTMGDVSLDTGYAEALIIYGDRTIQGVGGGVCQVSTTLFRTVFFGGYPVVERNPHAYRVYYYELNAANQVQTEMAGLDATVFVPLVDFKFKNDSPDWLLMETYVNTAGRSITWKFYSTSDGRTVDWNTTGLQNVVPPDEPVYEENPELPDGEIKQVDWEVEGADVTITRTVSKGGQVLFDDSFSTHYLPWRAVYEYGPGADIPDQPKDKKKRNTE